MKLIVLFLSLVVYCFGSPVDRIAKELDQLDSKDKNSTETGHQSSMIIEEATMVANWPNDQLIDYLGQVSGLSFCPKGFLYVFHRGDRKMNERSFDDNNHFVLEKEGPIKDNTILKISNKMTEPDVVSEFGEDTFFLPHGIFADKKYVWATDIALHQVFRFPHGSKKADLVLGERFTPGDDKTHFCKPTHAVTANDGSLFVADGYCNSRIVKFDPNGKFITQFGDKKGPGELSLPHHLVLIEDKNLICVADRENRRVQCYNAGLKNVKDTGKLEKVITHPRFGPVYAIGFNSLNNILYVISGMTDYSEKSRIFMYNWENDIITGVIDYPGANGFGMAHTISVCPRQQCITIGSLSKECPVDIETCMERVEYDRRYLPRNIWLYGLLDESVQLN